MAENLTADQIEALSSWLQANRTVPGWLDSYGLGEAYIDTRAAKGCRTDGRLAYVQLDRRTAKQFPELRGKQASEIRAMIGAK